MKVIRLVLLAALVVFVAILAVPSASAVSDTSNLRTDGSISGDQKTPAKLKQAIPPRVL